MESVVIWGMALVATCIVLVLVEIFVPSAGVIGVLAGLCGIAGVACLFYYDWRWGLGGIGVLAVLLPAVMMFGLHVMPSTPMGRRLIHGETGEPQAVLDTESPNPLEALVGNEGEVLTDLRPIGQIRLGGQRYDARSETVYLRPGERVKVVGVMNNQLVVRGKG